jgi:hypothetical protein
MRPFELQPTLSRMILRRSWLVLALAGCACAPPALAQNPPANTGDLFPTPGAPPPGTPTAPGTTPGTAPARPGTTETTAPTPTEPARPTTPTAPSDPPPDRPRNPFGFETPSEPIERRPSILTPETPSSTFGTGTDRLLTPGTTTEGGATGRSFERNQTTFSAPGFFGAGRQTFSSGEGRFAKPRFRYGVSAGIGFDDNFQQAPDQSGTEDTVVVQVIPAVPELSTTRNIQEFVGVRFIGGAFRPVFRTVQEKVVLRPFQPEQTIETVIPGVPAQPRLSSIVSTVDVNFNTQWVKAREALTFDLRLGAEYYWDREKDPLEYNGSLSLLHVRKMTPRAQLTTLANIVHQSQPDYSQVNVDTSTGGGAYTNALLKFDLGYRWKPRFNTNTSLTTQAVLYDSSGTNSGNSFYEVTLGNEFRYVYSPRSTYLVDVRYSGTRYLEDDLRNSNSFFILLGWEKRWSRRLTSSIRLGQSYRQFTQGGKQATPYGEFSATYQPTSRSQFTLSGRYGFENTQTADQESVTFRTGLSYSRAFTPRLSANAGLYYVNTQTTSITTNLLSETTTFDGNLGLTYRFNRRFSVSSRYSYTMLKTNFGLQDYDRSRFFLTGSYDF